MSPYWSGGVGVIGDLWFNRFITWTNERNVKCKMCYNKVLGILIELFKSMFIYKYFFLLKKKSAIFVFLLLHRTIFKFQIFSISKKTWFVSEILPDYFHIPNWYKFNSKLSKFEQIWTRNMKVIAKNWIFHFTELVQ